MTWAISITLTTLTYSKEKNLIMTLCELTLRSGAVFVEDALGA